MSSVTRISLFIVLSLALHLLSLSFNFMQSAKALEPARMGVDYVSRSADSFYPAPILKTSTRRVTQKQLQQVKKSIPVDPEKSEQVKLKDIRTKEIEPATLVSEFKKEKILPKAGVIATAVINSPVVKPITAPEPKKSPLIENAATEISVTVTETSMHEGDDPVFEDTAQKLSVPVSAVSEPQSGGVAALDQIKAKVPRSDQGTASLLRGQESINAPRQSSSALPRYDLNPSPHYPQVAKLRGWEGKVMFEVLILKNGRVGHLSILASSGYRSLDNAARKAINRWQFKPATSSGVSVDSQVKIPITFSLKDL